MATKKPRATKGSYWIDKEHPNKEPFQVDKSWGYEVWCFEKPFSLVNGPCRSYRAKDLKHFFRPATEEEIAWAVMKYT